MNVVDRMTNNPFTAHPNTSLSEARDLMKKQSIHRLPVVDDKGILVGIVTDKDLLSASPSQASTLDVWEIGALLAKLVISKVMTPNPVSCTQDTPIEEAARILSDNDIGGLPVMKDGKLTGIITESDIFEVFIELFAIRNKGLRATFLVPDKHGELASLAKAISDAGGDILSSGFVDGSSANNKLGIMKITGMTEQAIREAITPLVEEIWEIRPY